MVKQYSSILKCVRPGDSTIVDGVTVPGEPTILEYKCRYIPNTSAKTIKNSNNEVVVYRGTCYVPKPDTLIKNGDVVSVDGHFDDSVVLQVYPAQSRSRIIL